MAAEYSIKAIIAAVDRVSGPYRQIMGNVERATGRSMSQIGQSILGASNKIATMGLGFAAAGIGAAGAGVAKLVTDYADAADDVSKASRRLGFGIGELQGLRYAADLADVSIEELDGGLQTFGKGLGQMSVGTGKLFKFLGKVSPALRDQLRAAKDNGQAFDIMTAAIARVQDPAKRNTLAMMAFGGAGAKMTEMLAGGVEGLASLRAEFKTFGGELTTEQGFAAENYNDAITRVKTAMLSLRNAIGAKLIPMLQPLIDKFRAWIAGNHDMMVGRISAAVQGLAEWLGKVDWGKVATSAREFLSTAAALYEKIGGLKGILYAYGILLSVNVASGALTAAAAVATLTTALGGSAIALGPIAAIAAACLVIANRLKEAWDTYQKFSKTPDVPRVKRASEFAPDPNARPDQMSERSRRLGLFYDAGPGAAPLHEQRWDQERQARNVDTLRGQAEAAYQSRQLAMGSAVAQRTAVNGEIVVRVESDRSGVSVSSVTGSGPVDVSASVGRSTAGRRL